MKNDTEKKKQVMTAAMLEVDFVTEDDEIAFFGRSDSTEGAFA